MRNENAKVYAFNGKRPRGWRHGLHGVRLELRPVFLVPDPPAPCNQPFPSGYRGQRPDDRGLLQVDPVSSGTAHRAPDTGHRPLSWL